MTTAGTLVRAISLAIFGATAVAATGCTVHAQTPTAEAYYYTEPVPSDVYVRYPTYEHHGRRYVWYNNRWMYRGNDGRWAYLREEPYEFRRHRPYVQQAPPAYPYGGYGGYGGGPPPPLPAPR